MRLLDLLAEAISAEKEKALRDKFVQVVDKDAPKGMAPFEPNKISEKEFKALVDIDQSPNGAYLNWLIPRYVKLDRTERKRFFEDGHNEEVKNFIPFFDKNKQRLKKLNIDGFQADINLYKTLRDFENIMGVAKAKIEGSGEEQINAGPEKLRGAFIAPITILGQTPSGFVVYKVPQSCKGDDACYKKYLDITGCGDQGERFTPSREKEEAPRSGYKVTWCTRNTGMFNSYLTNGPYYVFKNWNTRRQYQLHYESGQLKDESDQEINGYNGKAQQEFLQFLLDKEGRIPTKSMSFNLDLKKFKVGEVNGFSIYKIGPAYYLDAKTGADQQNKLVYFDSSTGLLKNADGTQAGAKQALKYPYIYLLQYLMENDLVSKESLPPDAFKHWMMVRILGNINIPETAKPTIQGNINISNTGIKKLPSNLTITGDLNISNNPELTLPPGLKVGGTLDVRGTKINNVPPGTAAKVIQ
jgi:hypothetical protein